MKRFIGLLLLIPSWSWAIQVGDAKLPDSWTLEGQPLALNGAGLREYGTFRVNVYAAALYLAQPQKSLEAILKTDTPRVIHLKIFRGASREDSIKAWGHYFEANCKAPCVVDKTALDAFNALIPPSKAGDTQTYIFRSGQLELLNNNTKLGIVKNAEFANLVLSTWLGAVPTTEGLKRALLGESRK